MSTKENVIHVLQKAASENRHPMQSGISGRGVTVALHGLVCVLRLEVEDTLSVEVVCCCHSIITGDHFQPRQKSEEGVLQKCSRSMPTACYPGCMWKAEVIWHPNGIL